MLSLYLYDSTNSYPLLEEVGCVRFSASLVMHMARVRAGRLILDVGIFGGWSGSRSLLQCWCADAAQMAGLTLSRR